MPPLYSDFGIPGIVVDRCSPGVFSLQEVILNRQEKTIVLLSSEVFRFTLGLFGLPQGSSTVS